MQTRCYDLRSKDYRNYGARGIRVCDRWLADVRNFIEDVGLRPSALHTLDRIDNNGNYEPSNCRWATRIVQNRNRRDNRFVAAFGQTRCVSDWAVQTGLSVSVLSARLDRGWPVELALTSPPSFKRTRVRDYLAQLK